MSLVVIMTTEWAKANLGTAFAIGTIATLIEAFIVADLILSVSR